MSMVPMGGNKISPNPWLVDNYPDAYINMGLGTENIARKFGITANKPTSSPPILTKKLSPPSPLVISRTKRSRRSENHRTPQRQWRVLQPKAGTIKPSTQTFTFATKNFLAPTPIRCPR